jgi:hypothetical protein
MTEVSCTNNKPGKLNNYIRINILIIKTIHLITGTKLFSASSRTFTFVISVKGHVMVTVASIKCLLYIYFKWLFHIFKNTS